jgi:small GTP-binding protein
LFSGTIGKGSHEAQMLDRLQVERERGITVKAQTATLVYNYQGVDYLLNLIDTPGHVDFSFEVSRSLAACQGVILLVDANQGVQAQTVANFFLAFSQNLTIVPVMNKIDLKNADPDSVATQMKNVFEFEPKDILRVRLK